MLTSTEIENYAVIVDGTNQIKFDQDSDSVKLADGRIASVRSDNYLRIVGKSIIMTETYKLGIVSKVWWRILNFNFK